jgi:hypothetical protein
MLLIEAARQNAPVHRRPMSGQETRRLGGEKDRRPCQFLEIAETSHGLPHGKLAQNPFHRARHRADPLADWLAPVTLNYRALALKRADGFLRFWIADHRNYDDLIRPALRGGAARTPRG